MRSIGAVTSRVRRRIRVAERVFLNERHHFCWVWGVSFTILFVSFSRSADASCRGREIQRGGVCRWSRSRCDSAGEVDEDGRKESLVSCVFNSFTDSGMAGVWRGRGGPGSG